MCDIFEYLNDFKFFWLIGQIGIVLQLIGAFIFVIAAVRSKKLIKDIKATDETNATWIDIARATYFIKKLIQEQARTEWWGFVFLGLGLFLQIVGGFI